MADLAALRSALPPPAEGARRNPGADWRKVELALSVPVPDTYKTFLATWGAGSLSDFLVFLTPASPLKPVRYVEATQGFVAAYAHLKSSHPADFPLPILPAEGSFLPFAISDNGDYAGWMVETGSPAEWPVAIVAHEYGVPEHTGRPLLDFLHDLATDAYRPRSFPAALFRDGVTFKAQTS